LRVINQFLDRVDEVIKQISANPLMYLLYQESKEVRKCVVNNEVTLFFKVKKDQMVYLLEQLSRSRKIGVVGRFVARPCVTVCIFSMDDNKFIF
ncbi:MAG: hypothetical protein O6939_06190, partial [Bacteroidetes bacterium]|nr:hypothetical protein [Bacteroidota bacterium]